MSKAHHDPGLQRLRCSALQHTHTRDRTSAGKHSGEVSHRWISEALEGVLSTTVALTGHLDLVNLQHTVMLTPSPPLLFDPVQLQL